MAKEEDILNPCGHRNSERIEALKKLPSSICPACLFERIKELEELLTECGSHLWLGQRKKYLKGGK